jgi:hypothetical protein
MMLSEYCFVFSVGWLGGCFCRGAGTAISLTVHPGVTIFEYQNAKHEKLDTNKSMVQPYFIALPLSSPNRSRPSSISSCLRRNGFFSKRAVKHGAPEQNPSPPKAAGNKTRVDSSSAPVLKPNR